MATVVTYSKAALDRILADFRQNLQGYKAMSVGGNVTISPTDAGTFALDLTGDTTLTINGKLGQIVVLDVVTAGKTLTVVNGPKITAGGLYALTLSRGVWKGGATGGGSTGGGSTDGGSTTPTPGDGSLTLIGKLDLAGVADGTKMSTINLSNGTTPVAGTRLETLGGKIVVIPDQREGELVYRVSTPKQRVSATYNLPRNGEVRVGLNVAGGIRQTPCLIRIFDTGRAEFSNPDGDDFTLDAALPTFPKTGTVTIDFDATTGTGAAYLDGARLGGFTSPTYMTFDAAKRRAGGIYLVSVEADRPSGPNPVTLSDVKLEALP